MLRQLKRTRIMCALRAGVISVAFPILTANATSITVPNFSFESPALPNGTNNNGGNGDTTAIPGWTISAPPSSGVNNGVYHPASGFTSTQPFACASGWESAGLSVSRSRRCHLQHHNNQFARIDRT